MRELAKGHRRIRNQILLDMKYYKISAQNIKAIKGWSYSGFIALQRSSPEKRYNLKKNPNKSLQIFLQMQFRSLKAF